jgi:hypothetical protein
MSDGEPTEDQYHIARVISDVWLSNLLAWLHAGRRRPTSASGSTCRSPCSSGREHLRSSTQGIPDDSAAALDVVAGSHALLIACDFDGTLAPIVSNPADARRACPPRRRARKQLSDLPSTHVALYLRRALSVLRELCVPCRAMCIWSAAMARSSTRASAHPIDEALLESNYERTQ